MSKSLDVVAVGSWTNFDHIFRVEKIPEPGQTVQITSPIERVEIKTWGGCAQNNAAAAAQLGFQAGLMGLVGEDYFTSGYFEYMNTLQVDQRGVIIVPGTLCGHSFLYSAPGGESICISHVGIAESQDKFSPNRGILSQTKAVILNYRFDQFTLEAAKLAKNSNSLVAVSGALTTAPTLAKSFIQNTDIIFGTGFEIDFLLALLDIQSIQGLFDQGIQSIFQTMGKEGCRIITETQEYFVPAVKADRVVDVVGAGDAFVGAAVAYLSREYNLVEAAKVGATVASFVVEEWGCQTNIPSADKFGERYSRFFREPSPIS